MSIEYDEYLNEHVGAVQKGWQWMETNLMPRLENWIKANYKADEFDIYDVERLIAEHDRSKIEPDEYYFYDDYFYLSKNNRSHEVVKNFHRAFLMHMHRNPHHWQYWVMSSDNKGEPSRCVEMPLTYIFEMICDWWSFSWRKGDLTEIFKWWDEHKDYIQLHIKSRKAVEKILEEMKKILATEKDEPQPNDRDPLPPEGVKEIATEIQHVPEAIGHSDEGIEENNPKKFGVPEIKKYPMPDADHVRSAIRFFNYISPEYEKELADAILERAKEYGVDLDEMNIGDENKFKKYMPKEGTEKES